jgi:hypothetical protein
MGYLADSFSEINSERRRIRKESGLPDDNYKTAMGADLDACAAWYDVYRKPYENDYELTKRVDKEADLLHVKFGIGF